MENEDNIQFDPMPKWGDLFASNDEMSKKEKHVEKEYDSLYDELFDKCDPGKYKDEELERFNIANDIYDQLKQGGKEISEHALRYLRNRAIDELGIHISTTKVFNRLISLINPDNFTKIEPYNKELVEKARKVYDLLKAAKDDIRALEQLEDHPDTIRLVDEYYYYNLTPEEYLEKRPYGKHSIEIRQQLIKEEEAFFVEESAFAYLDKYPQGCHKEESSCYKDNSARIYLKRYPNGRYYEEALKDRRHEFGLIGFLSVVVIGIIIMIIVTNH